MSKAKIEWNLVKSAPEYKIPKVNIKVIKKTNDKLCVIVPDAQIGYYRDKSGKLRPTQDEKAINIALSIIKDIRPNLVICVGDNLDFPEFGKYRTTPAFKQTTQAAIDRAGLFAAQLRRSAPRARIIWLAGNHEERLPNYILDNAFAIYGLRNSEDVEAGPALSVPHRVSKRIPCW